MESALRSLEPRRLRTSRRRERADFNCDEIVKNVQSELELSVRFVGCVAFESGKGAAAETESEGGARRGTLPLELALMWRDGFGNGSEEGNQKKGKDGARRNCERGIVGGSESPASPPC